MFGFSVYLKIGGYINMKKIFAFVLAMIMVACMLVGCGEVKTAYDSEKDAVVETVIADLVQIPGYDYLYYSTKERTVYYLYKQGSGRSATGYMCEYIRNGHTCKYVGGEIVEVIPTVQIEDSTN